MAIQRNNNVPIHRGRLGSGAFWPAVGSPIQGNVFGPNNVMRVAPTPPASRPFGSPSNAGNGTQFGQNRVTTGLGLLNPNSPQHDVAQLPQIVPIAFTGQFQRVTPQTNMPQVQPGEKLRFARKVIRHYKTAYGATRTMPTDTAFRRVPPVKQSAPAPVPQIDIYQVPRSLMPSFHSRNNLWFDPNNSFLQGKAQPVNGDVGRGRWAFVKRGAAG